MENKISSKSARRKLFFTRCGVFAILLLMLLPMLCSFAYPATITISNPFNLPYEYDTFLLNDEPVGFGSHVLNEPLNITCYVENNVLTFDSTSYVLVEGDIPNGYYSINYTLLSSIDTTSGVGLFPYEGLDSVGTSIEENAGFIFAVGDITSFVLYENSAPGLEFFHCFILSPITPPTPTDTITNVWTSITNWVISSLNIVQGVFIHDNSIRPLLDMTNSLTVEGTTLYLADSVDAVDLYYNGISFADINFDFTDVVIDNVNYTLASFDGQLLVAQHFSTDGITSYLNPVLTTAASGSGLTLLGTLAVIGVSIGICFLLIGVIQKFLRFRA